MLSGIHRRLHMLTCAVFGRIERCPAVWGPSDGKDDGKGFEEEKSSPCDGLNLRHRSACCSPTDSVIGDSNRLTGDRQGRNGRNSARMRSNGTPVQNDAVFQITICQRRNVW